MPETFQHFKEKEERNKHLFISPFLSSKLEYSLDCNEEETKKEEEKKAILLETQKRIKKELLDTKFEYDIFLMKNSDYFLENSNILNIENDLEKIIVDYFENNLYSRLGENRNTFLKTKLDLLNSSENYKNEIKRIYSSIEKSKKIGKRIRDEIINNLNNKNIDLKKITRITIQKGVIMIVLENGKEIRNYEIDVSDDKKGFKIKEPKIINVDKRQKEKEEREDELNKKHIYYPALGLTLIVGLEILYEAGRKKFLEKVTFVDEKGKEHEISVSKKISLEGTEQETIKKAISYIKEQTDYELNIDKETGKSFFESPESRNLKISDMIENIEKTFTFEDFKKNLDPNEKIDEAELKKQFEEQKAKSIEILRGIELQEGPLVNPSRFMRKLLVQSPKFMSLQHIILFPIFFKEMQKKPGNLDSYFKGAGEMATFNAGATASIYASKKILEKEFAKQAVDKTLSFLPGGYGVVARWLATTAVSVIGGALGITVGEKLAEKIGLQQKFDENFPESQDFIHKIIKKNIGQDENYLYLPSYENLFNVSEWDKVDLNKFLAGWSSFFIKDAIVDPLKLNIYVPPFPHAMWESDVNFNTDKQDYLSGSSKRDKKFFNEMVDLMGDNLVDKFGDLVEEFKDKKKHNFGELVGVSKKETLLKKVKEMIYAGDEQTNKGLKDVCYKIILHNIDDFISGKIKEPELKTLFSLQLDRFKIDDNYIKNRDDEIKEKKAMAEIVFGDKNQKDGDVYLQANSMLNGDKIFDYIKSLTGAEKEFAKNYFYRTMNKEEVIQTEQMDKFSDWWNKSENVGKKENSFIENHLLQTKSNVLRMYPTIAESTKDGLKSIKDIITGTSSFVEGENSDEAIYERLVKNPLFHQYTLWVKQCSDEQDFLESIKE